MDENKVTGLSYLINFFKDVQSLTHHNAQYLNILLELEDRYSNVEDLSKMEDSHKTILIQWIQSLRYFINKCYISFKSLDENLKIDKDITNKICSLYEQFKTKFIIDRNEIEEFVLIFNKIIVKESELKKLLQSSEDYINKVFSNNEVSP